MSSIALTVKSAPVSARSPAVSCMTIASGNMTRPATWSSLPKVRIADYYICPGRIGPTGTRLEAFGGSG